MKVAGVAACALSSALVAQALGGWEGPAKERKGLTTYSGKVQGWKKGVKTVGILGEDEGDKLVTGKIDANGNFTLNFSNDKKMLDEYALPLSLTVPYKDMCTYDVCEITISNPEALWLKSPAFYTVTNGDHGEAFINGEEVKAPKPIDLFKIASVNHLVYASDNVDVVGQVINKENGSTVTYDLHLPAGWSFVQEWSDRTFDAKGGIVRTERVFRSVPPPSTAWEQ
ncbi:hypothetical protein [Deinococcus phoenicis]|uniref:hypothetical protein n=1 Tax=Deinococcus phoenicis TaxID=1476583 RepID=UPI0012684628|nr:hypothetical protein [Deinococcus phoenicis]